MQGGRPCGRPKTAFGPCSSNRRTHRLMVLVEQYNTAPTVAHECPSAKSSKIWARNRTSASGDPR
jgi:hypothetical protein